MRKGRYTHVHYILPWSQSVSMTERKSLFSANETCENRRQKYSGISKRLIHSFGKTAVRAKREEDRRNLAHILHGWLKRHEDIAIILNVLNVLNILNEEDSPERRISQCASVTERESGTVRTGERKRREMERIECVLPWLRICRNSWGILGGDGGGDGRSPSKSAEVVAAVATFSARPCPVGPAAVGEICPDAPALGADSFWCAGSAGCGAGNGPWGCPWWWTGCRRCCTGTTARPCATGFGSEGLCMPMARHFLSRQYWQWLRLCKVTTQSFQPRHLYTNFSFMQRLKKALQPSQLMTPQRIPIRNFSSKIIIFF